MGGVTGENMQSRAYRAAEFPAGNMITNAHSIARMYAATVSDIDGIRLLQPDTVAVMTDIDGIRFLQPDGCMIVTCRQCTCGILKCRRAPRSIVIFSRIAF